MKTVVFVDELLLVNFAAAAALLLGAGLLCGRSCTGLRLCAGSAAAAVSTLALLAPPGRKRPPAGRARGAAHGTARRARRAAGNGR